MSALLPKGFLSTAGSQIVNEAGVPVRICSVSWTQGFGDIPATVRAIVDAGFNCVRASYTNANLATDLQRLDAIVNAARPVGLKVIIDHHTDEAGTAADGWGSQQKNGLPYDVGGAADGTNGAGVPGTVTLDRFISDWAAVAAHFKGDATVIGHDLINEPLSYAGMCTWGDGNPDRDLVLIYQRVGNAIQAVGSGPLIICEGPQNYDIGAPWGDLSSAGEHPVVLSLPNKVVYSVHDYPQEISGIQEDSGDGKIASMNRCWGYLVREGIAPVWVGEMGSSMLAPTSAAWAQTLTDYMNGQCGDKGGPTFSGNQQPISGNWWAWGSLDGQLPDGTLDANGNLRPDQKAVWSKLMPIEHAAEQAPEPAAAATPAPAPTQAATKMPPAPGTGTIIDVQGHVWAIDAPGQVIVDGVPDMTTSNVVELAYVNGVVWALDTKGQWRSKGASGWSAGTSKSPLPVPGGTSTTPPPPITPPPVTPPPVTPPPVTPPPVTPPPVTPPPTGTTPASPDNTVISAAGGAITDLNGNVWTLKNGQVVVNGTVDASTSNVVEMAFVDGHVWQETNQSLWWSKVTPADAWSPAAGTRTNPLTVGRKPSLTFVSISSGRSIVISGSDVMITNPNGAVVRMDTRGYGSVKLGGSKVRLSAVGMSSLIIQGGTEDCSVVLDGGKNSITAGKGGLDVVGGTNGDAYTYDVGAGMLTIENFNAKDTLAVGVSLQPSMKIASDGADGTNISFAGKAAGIILRRVRPENVPAIRWI